jgi:prevent-host-death family protein
MSAEASKGAYNIHDAKTNLSRIIDRVEHGEEIIISRAGTPVAKVVPLNPRAERTGRGSLSSQLVLTDDWNAPAVNEEIARDFGLTQP